MNDPRVALDSYVKLRGSTADATVFQAYEGDIFAIIDGRQPELLLGFKGIQKSEWRRDGLGGYRNKDFDIGFYVDPVTREIVNEWANPVTGRTVKVYHYRGGPSGGHFQPGDEGGDVYGGPSGRWAIAGDQISHCVAMTSARTNPQMPDDMPLSFSGKTLFGAMSFAFVGRLSEVADPAATQVRATQVWTNTTAWMPWMEMGLQPGFNEWRWIGAKGVNKTELDHKLVAAAEQVQPGYVSTDAQWTVPTSGRQDFLRLKRGLPLTD